MANMTKKIAINGFGRIGRLVLRNALELDDVDIVAVNDISDVDNLVYLLKYDSIQARPQADIRRGKDSIIWNNREIRVLSDKDPAHLPWRELGVNAVTESSAGFPG